MEFLKENSKEFSIRYYIYITMKVRHSNGPLRLVPMKDTSQIDSLD